MPAVTKLTSDSIKEPGPANTLLTKVNELTTLVNNLTGDGTAGPVAATTLAVTGSASIGDATTDTVGFYGTTPIAKQTGVAVTIAAVHAALVALGLIAA